jgi:D-amino-acid dehydrogenase
MLLLAVSRPERSEPRGEIDLMERVAVIGGGLVGASAAYRLVCHGAQVTLIDRGHQGQATAASAGILPPGNRFIGGDDILPLLKQAHAYYPELLAGLAEDGETQTGYEVVGALHVATTEQEVARLPELLYQVQERRASGFHHIGDVALVDLADARALFPPLGPVLAAIHMAGAARVDGRLLRDALYRVLRRRGASMLHGSIGLLLEGNYATGVTVDDRAVPADAVIIAAGAWSGGLADRLGVRVPVYPQRGQIAHLLVPDADTSRWPSVLGFHSHYLVTFPGNRVVVGATREDGAGYDYRATAAGVHEVLSEALRLAPGLAQATVHEVRIGFRPASPDQMPVLGPAPGVDNLYFATGHGGYGLQVGPWSGAMVADLALGRSVSLDLNPFAPERFQRSG